MEILSKGGMPSSNDKVKHLSLPPLFFSFCGCHIFSTRDSGIRLERGTPSCFSSCKVSGGGGELLSIPCKRTTNQDLDFKTIEFVCFLFPS